MVRFNGGHARDRYLTGVLSQFVEFAPVCPEVEIGLGTPRETIRLERTDGGSRLVATKSGTDLTETMKAYAQRKTAALAGEDLSGFILKKDSPSCGLMRVKVYDQNGVPSRSGQGVFAEALCAAFPHLPIEEEGRLNDPALRENFLERVFAYRRLEDFFAAKWKVDGLVGFHTREKILIMAHDPASRQILGRLVAEAKANGSRQTASEYQAAFMQALEKKATPGRNANALNHMASYIKKQISSVERQELAALIEDYRRRLTPLIVPLTLIRHFVRLYGISYLAGQTYLEPHPKELMLRNHV
jgi:uncharacterized protein YbgA (DUF1722 family)/uncharacterized protein YbbK (DUF523 family)